MLLRSVLTSGSAFSFMVRAADVCLINRFKIPVVGSDGNLATISPVMRWNPAFRGDKENSTCWYIGVYIGDL